MRRSSDHAASGGRAAPTFDLAIRIERPPGPVFAFLADVQDAEPIPRRAAVRMVKEPAGATAAGTRWHEQVRIAPGCWLRIDSVVTEVDPPRRLGMDFRSRWFTGHLDYEIDPAGSGSVLRQRETITVRPALRRAAPLLERQLGSHLVERLRDIKAVLEA